MIYIDLNQQTLSFLNGNRVCHTWPISSGKNGIGEINDSGCTPRGKHRVFSKIGNYAPLNSVFSGRQWTGEIYSPELAEQYPGRDWILTRIMQLDGLQPGFNSGGDRDSLSRYIYIHGTPDTTDMSQPGSKGCIRMHNPDLIRLFDLVQLNDYVFLCV